MSTTESSMLTGRVVGPGDADYAAASAGWNLPFAHTPSAVVIAQKTQDVVNALAWARQNGLPVRARSGRHCLEGRGHVNAAPDAGSVTQPRWYPLFMLNSDYTGQNCSIARALEAVGERWTLLIVRELLRRPHRFAELERKLGIAKNVLTKRLEKLVDLRIVERMPYTEARDWNDYRLTRKGKDLFPVISALMAWGDRYLAPDGPPVIFEHECGHAAGHKLVCAYCGDDVVTRSVKVIAGPGANEQTMLS